MECNRCTVSEILPGRCRSSSQCLFLQLERCSAKKGRAKVPVDVTFADLAQDTQKFDGRLVRVRALLALSWEGDNFLSEPTPESLPSNAPSVECPIICMVLLETRT